MPLDPFGVDTYLDWNGDFIVTPNGDLQTASGWDRIRQRIIRRMITNPSQLLPSGRWTPADYIFEKDYGLGLGSLVDQPQSDDMINELERRIGQAVLQDDNIDSAVPPAVQFFREPSGGLFIIISVTLLSGVAGRIAVRSS